MINNNFIQDDSRELLVNSFIDILKQKTLYEMTGSETRLIYQLLSQMDYFRKLGKIISSQEYWLIASNMKIQDLKKSNTIYNYGDKPKCFYIILKGSVCIKIPKLKIKENGIIKKIYDTKFHEIQRYYFGEGFGEYALYYKCQRESTSECLEDTTILCFPQEIYNNIFVQYEKDKVLESLNYFKKNKFFNDFTSTEQEKLHFFLNHRLYFSGQSVFKESSSTDGIYFIKTGHYELYKDYHQNDDSTNNNSINDKVCISIFDLTNNDVFGDVEVVLKLKTRSCNVLCTNAGEIIFLNKFVFFNIVSSFSLIRKLENIKKKVEIMNNNFKIKAINFAKPQNTLESKFNSARNNLYQKHLSKNYDMNSFGFGQEAYIKWKNFEKKLDNFVIGSMSSKEYIMYEKKPVVLRVKKNKVISSLQFPIQNHEPNSTDRFDSPFLKSNTHNIFNLEPLNDQTNFERKNMKSKTKIGLPSIIREKFLL